MKGGRGGMMPRPLHTLGAPYQSPPDLRGPTCQSSEAELPRFLWFMQEHGHNFFDKLCYFAHKQRPLKLFYSLSH